MSHDAFRVKASQPRERIYLVILLSFVFSAGVFAYAYVVEANSLAPLILYLGSLTVAVFGFRTMSEPIDGRSQSTSSHKPRASNEESKCLYKTAAPSLPESVGRASIAITQEDQPVEPKQGSLDLDGTFALRSLTEVSGNWLVTDATDYAAKSVEKACLHQPDLSGLDQARVRKWFEIAKCLRSQKSRAFQKAEARRAYVAELKGVSKEQVRQIDQGRYTPLNKILQSIQPSDLV